MKTVFETTTTLYPRLDKDHHEVVADTIKSLVEENPEYSKLWMRTSFTEYATGEATLTISIMDPNKTSWKEVVQPFLRPAFWVVFGLYTIWYVFFKD